MIKIIILIILLFLPSLGFSDSMFNNGGIFNKGSSSGSGSIGIGTTGQEAVYTSSTTIGPGIITDNGTNVGIGTASNISARLAVFGSIVIVGGSSQGGLFSGNGKGLEFDPNSATGILNPSLTLTSGENVGIGTGNTTPSAPLEVKGTTFLSTGSTFSTPELTFDANGSNFPAWYTPGGATDSILKLGASTGVNTNPTSAIFSADVDTGNVGIGTEIPASKFYVNGTTKTTNLTIASIASGTQCLHASSSGVVSGTGSDCGSGGGSGNSFSASAGQGDLSFYDVQGTLTLIGGNSGLYYSGTSSTPGNVGIGTIHPGQILDVQGTVRSTNMIDTGVTASKVVVTNASQQLTAASNVQDLAYCQTGGTNCPGSITGFANPSATIRLSANNGSATTSMRSDATPALDVTISPTWTGNHTFSPSSGNTLFSAGNVGIGSPTPGQILDIQGTVRMTGFALTGNGANNGYVMVGNNIGLGTWMPAGSLPISAGSSAAGDTNAVQYNSGSSTFAGAENKFSFNGTNVGIGTTNGIENFDVQGTLTVAHFAGGVGIGTTLVSGTGTLAGLGSLVVMNGNVGIGTWKPVSGLVVGTTVTGTTQGATGNGIAMGTNGNMYASGSISDGGTISCENLGASQCGFGNGTIANSAGGVPATLIVNNVGTANSSGKIIGTSTQNQPLVIEATNQNSTLSFTQIDGGNNGATKIATFMDSGNVGIGTMSPNGELDEEGTVNYVVFNGLNNSNNNVGIGTFRPGQLLDVQGTIKFKNSLINTASSTGIGWSEHNATNQACNTTCGTSACVIGLDIGTVGVVNSGFVACTDATADDCICAGP